MIPKDSKVAKKIQQLIEQAWFTPGESLMSLEEDDGTYSFWINTEAGEIASLSLEDGSKKISRKELERAYARQGPPGPP